MQMLAAATIAGQVLPMPNEVVDQETGEVLTLLGVNANNTGDYVGALLGEPVTLTWFAALETMVPESGLHR